MSDRDNAIADPRTYSDEDRIHAILKDLRDNDPVHWTAPEGFRPYWAITKYADILEIERQNEIFHNEPRSTLMNVQTENDLAAMWGGPDPKDRPRPRRSAR